MNSNPWLNQRHLLRSLILESALVCALVQAFPLLAQPVPLQLFHAAHPAMGSEFTIDLYAPDQQTATRWTELSFEEVDRIEVLLSNYRPSSELSRISREAGNHSVTTDPETFAFLQSALRWSERTHGAFDITVGPLMRAWGFFFNNGRIPPKDELDRLREHTGWRKISLSAKSRSVAFAHHASLELDPGGIGKGYAVDRVVALLREQHVTAALISAGSSSIYALGSPPESAGWQINVPDPADPHNLLTSIALRDSSLSTSACTEKFFIKDGHRYCHILDPHTSRPVENMLQTTIVAPLAIDTDALSTATFVMGAKAATHLLGTLPATAAVIVSGTPSRPEYHAIRWPQHLRTSNTTEKGERK